MRSGRPPRSATDRTLSDDSDKSLVFSTFRSFEGCSVLCFFFWNIRSFSYFYFRGFNAVNNHNYL